MASTGTYRVGVARVVITPAETMWAAGYAHRNAPADAKVHDLYAKALAIEDDAGERLVLLTTDLLGLPRALAESVAQAVGRRCGLQRRQIMLTSSHTHCGPVLRDSLTHIYELGPQELAKVDAYTDRLETQLANVIADAIEDLAPARLSHGRGRATFAANRREVTPEGEVILGHNPDGPVDHDVPVLRVMGEAGALRAVVFGYACHATTLDISQWCGDYPGFAQANLEAAHPGSAALFVAGCGADANPLPRRSLEACVKHGRSLADAVENVLAAEMTPIRGRLAAAFNLLDLPFDHLPEREALERHRDHGHPIERGWAARLIAELDAGRELPPSYPCALQAFRLGDRLTLVALAGEVVVEYAHRIKSATGRDDTWVVAYANDVFGYVPSRRVLAEGGYEADLATAVYGLPARWSPVIEERIVTAATDMIASVRCVGDQEGETGEG